MALPGAGVSRARDAVVRSGNIAQWARCHGCETLLADKSVGGSVRLASGLVPRPEREPETNLPRFGPSRRRGHGDPRRAGDFLVDASTRDIGHPMALYVNCPNCDRGQVVRFVDPRSARTF